MKSKREQKIKIIKGEDYNSEGEEIWMKTVEVMEWCHIIHSDKVHPDDTYVIRYKEK